MNVCLFVPDISAANVSLIPCRTYRYYGDGVSAVTEVLCFLFFSFC